MQARLFPEGTVPEWATAEWYAKRERAPHLEQPGHQGRLTAAARLVLQAARVYGCSTVSDLGAGDGGLLTLLRGAPLEAWGYDLQPTNVAGAAERGVKVELADVLTESVRYGDISVCTEMLEHLVDPHEFLRDLPSRVVIASSPAFETAESHYAFHLWAFDMEGYRELVEQGGYTVVSHEIAGDFQVLMGTR